ncbi:hypothetical protein I4F81_008319 [Pyropia yezoensis]|uniref:Uncharacterized protein n=1 Tax=Pyropia yezoensis TaxID=2788 RepID=A0ACC3C740_PYRYE|nr:hypothetical protein I4F81_008319 [Neopyropia yezoensis]
MAGIWEPASGDGEVGGNTSPAQTSAAPRAPWRWRGRERVAPAEPGNGCRLAAVLSARRRHWQSGGGGEEQADIAMRGRRRRPRSPPKGHSRTTAAAVTGAGMV